MDLGPIVRVLEDVLATIPVEREPAGAPVPREPQIELPEPRGATTLVSAAGEPGEGAADGTRA